MVNKKTLRNLLMASALVSLQACGGGGGGGGAVTSFVDDVVSELSGSSSIVNQYYDNLANFNSLISGGEFSSLSAINNPNSKTREDATSMLKIIKNAEQLWTQTLQLIQQQDVATQRKIYASDTYKSAYAELLYLKETVKPIVDKVSKGTGITTNELQKVSYAPTVVQEIQKKKTEKVEQEVTATLSSLEEPVVEEPKEPVVEEPKEEHKDEVVEADTALSETPFTGRKVDQTESEEITKISFSDYVKTKNGTSTQDIVKTKDNGDGTHTITTTTYTYQLYNNVRNKTTRVYKVVTPRLRDGVDTVWKIKGTVTTYTTETYDGSSVEVDISNETVEDIPVALDAELIDTNVVESKQANAYTDHDSTLGDKTAGLSSVIIDHETAEYKKGGGLDAINASSAYARGWTGKGAVLGIVDTYQDITHNELNGQYLDYTDYVVQDDTVENRGQYRRHGTHVAGIIAGKKDGTGTHGVAYDAKLIGANVDYYGGGTVHMSFAQTAVDDMAIKKKNEGTNIVAINMSFNREWLPGSGREVSKLSDGSFKIEQITDKIKNGQGQAIFYKPATDQDIILVNSAGNGGKDFAWDPGIWATETDSKGNLVLGGKMLVVGRYDNGKVIGNKAGHVCMKVNTVTDSCGDTYRLSDFYILAPGEKITSSVLGGGYDFDSGTSMAAPHVTGALGILNQMWPWMKGENLVKLVTQTANKDLPGYDVNVHGQGLLDLDAATKPQGAVGIPTVGRTKGNTNVSSVEKIALDNSFASLSSSSLSNIPELQSLMIIDAFDRDYYIDMTKSIKVQDKRKFSDVKVAEYGASYLPFQQQYGNYEQGGQFPVFMEGLEFGLYTDKDGNGDWSTNISKKFKLSDKFSIKTTAGTMNEQDTWLGNYTDGALSVGKNNVTNFGQLGVEYMLGTNTFTFDVAQGYTDVKTKDNSLITSVDRLETQSMKLGFEKKIDSTTRWGITYSIPNRITKGGVNMNVPYATSADGTIVNKDIKADMSASTPEKDIGVYFSHNGEGETDWKTSFSIEYRQNVAGVAGDNKIAPSLQVSKKFYGACMKLFGMMNKKPGCETVRLQKEIKKLAKKKGTEDKIAALKYQLLGVEKQIAHINGDKQTVAKIDKELALGWKQ